MTGTVESKTSLLPRHSEIVSVPDRGVLSLDQVMVGILTALPKEYKAVREVLQCNREVVAMRDGANKVYRLGVVRPQADRLGFVVAVALLIDMGNVAAATRATDMVNDCPNIRDIIVCGIAGAVPNPASPEDHVRVGDIVVSTEGVLQYDFGRQVLNCFQINAAPYRPSPNLVQTARFLQAEESSEKRPWEEYIDLGLSILPAEFRRPPSDTDMLREANWRDPRRLPTNVSGYLRQLFGGRPAYPPIRHPSDPHRSPGRPRVFHGLIASASRVLKDPATRERLRRDHNAKAVEMETAGAAHSAYTAEIGYFVVRGTCDYCNLDKNDVWHGYAALAAAAYTRSLLQAINIKVFHTTPKVLVTIEPVTSAVVSDEDHVEVPQEYIQHVLSEANVNEAPSGALEAVNVELAVSRTSEAIREIPRIGNQIKEGPSQGDLAGIHSPLPSDAFIKEPVRETSKIVVPGTLPSTTEPKDVSSVSPGAKLSDREQQLLASEGQRQLAELKEFLEKWEFNRAFAALTVAADWIERNEAYIAPALASQIYEMLARVETVKAQRTRESGETADFTKARYYVSKAKNARTR